jgi:hypothetical protein
LFPKYLLLRDRFGNVTVKVVAQGETWLEDGSLMAELGKLGEVEGGLKIRDERFIIVEESFFTAWEDEVIVEVEGGVHLYDLILY